MTINTPYSTPNPKIIAPIPTVAMDNLIESQPIIPSVHVIPRIRGRKISKLFVKDFSIKISKIKITFAAINKIREISEDVGVSMTQLSLAWLLEQECVACVVAGARSPEQVEEIVKGSDIKLSKEIISRLNEVTELIKTFPLSQL